MKPENPVDKTLSTSFPHVVPKCSSVLAFRLWKEMARISPPSKTVGFCEDCTAGFKAARIADFTCENPLIVFEKNQLGFIDGCLPKVESEEYAADRRKK